MALQGDVGQYGQKTILLLGKDRAAVVLARGLSRRGYRVICGREGDDGGAEHSRYVDEIWHHPLLKAGPAVFLTALDAFMARCPGLQTVFPVSDKFVRFFADLNDAERECYRLAMVDSAVVRRCMDKAGMMEFAESLAVPTSPFAVARNLSEMATGVGKTGFPLVIRPERSTDRFADRKAVICDDFSAVSGLLKQWPTGQKGLILQRQSPGRRHKIYFAAADGRLTRYLHAVVTGTDEANGTGTAVQGTTVAADEGLKRHMSRLIEALNYTGVGCAHFLFDEKTGQASFLKINPGISGDQAVTEHAGLGLSAYLVDLAEGREVDTGYIEGRPGIRHIWTRAALEAVKLGFQRGEMTGNAALFAGMRILWRSLSANSHATFAWRDPLPGIMALWSLKPGFNPFRKPLLDEVASNN